MRTYRTLLLTVATALLALPIAPADAAKRSKPTVKPKITRVTPMRLSVGETLVIRGTHFKARPGANTVVFQGAGGRSAFVKPRAATKRKLVVRLSASVSRLLNVKSSRQVPTRLRLRVLAGRFSAFTPRRLSPVVVSLTDGGPGSGAPEICKKDSDHDNDLLPNQLELDYGTDPCLPDTDDDGISDGWEVYAAKDLNVKAVPYPGKRPFPNALDPSDKAIDFDGDGLDATEEYRAWRITGSSFVAAKAGEGNLESPLGYSDGTQFSRASETPAVPAWRGPLYGLAAPAQPFPATFDLHGDASWRDDERDADRDGLSNWLESLRGPGTPAWWKGYWAKTEHKAEDWPEPIGGCGQAPGSFKERPFASLDLADPDVDGDTLLDGEDDQDNDDFTNISELYEIVYDLDGDGNSTCGFTVAVPTVDLGGSSRLVNSFNPCAPNPDARTCPLYAPQ
jgi:hypothetical protein